MHPIERLRAVARAEGVDQRVLAREAAATLGALAGEPFGLVTSCRRLLDRHPGAGTLWWACARLLDATDARSEARSIARDLDDDAVARTLALDVPDRAAVVLVPDPTGGSDLVRALQERRGDVTVTETDFPPFDLPAALDARDPSPVPSSEPGTGPAVVVVEAGAAGPDAFLTVPGTAEALGMPGARAAPVWLALAAGRRLPGPLFDAATRLAPESEVVPLAAVDRVIEPRRLPCPAPAELLRRWSA